MKEVFTRICKILRRNWLSLFVFDVVYRFTLLSLLVAAVNFSLDLAMDLMGYSYITIGNLDNFLMNPVVLLLITGALLVLLFLTLAELSALFYCYEYSEHRMHIGPVAMLFLGWERAIRIVKRMKFWNVIWMFFLLPFLYHPVLLILFYRYGIWGQMLSVLFSGNSYIPAVIGIFVFVLITGIFSVFLIPCILIEEVSLKKTWWMIRRYFRKYFLRGGKYLVLWNLLLTLVNFVLYMVLVMGMGLVLHWMEPEGEYLYAKALDYHNWILLILMMLFAFISLLMNSALIHQLYNRIKRRESGNLDFLHEFNDPVHFLPKKRFMLIRILVVLLVLIEIPMGWIYVRDSAGIAESPFNMVMITAHRGNSVETPENTLIALESAMDQMADYGEIDVQLTSDGVVVLLHDFSLLRTCGVPDYLYDVSYPELQELDAGRYMGEQFAGEKVPALAQVLEYCKGKLNLNIELKSHVKYRDDLVEAVVQLVELYNMENQCVLTSMDYTYLKNVKTLNPDIRTGYIVRNLYGSLNNMKYADFISVKQNSISSALVERAHGEGKEVWCWTVNSPSEVKKMCSMKVDNIITDNPAMVRSVIAQERFSLNLMDLFEMLIFTE